MDRIVRVAIPPLKKETQCNIVVENLVLSYNKMGWQSQKYTNTHTHTHDFMVSDGWAIPCLIALWMRIFADA